MGKRSREKRQTQAGSPPDSAANRAAQPTPARAALTGRRRLAFRLLVTLGVPLLLLPGLELALRVAGHGFSTRYFERAADGTNLTTNPRFAWQFYSRETSTAPTPLLVTAEKPAGTTRILVLGESAAAGTPDPAFSFSRMLEVMLRGQYPDRRFEVINVAMRGINSHILLPIAREAAALSPDLSIVYAGNNELIGLHSPSPTEFSLTQHLRLLRMGHALKRTRTYQLFQNVLKRFLPVPPDKRQDMEYLRTQRLALDDPKRRAVYDNFRANLEDICGALQRDNAPVLLCNVAVNLRDFPPLASLHRADLSAAQLAEWDQSVAKGSEAAAANQHGDAAAHFQKALSLDDHHAELHFSLARALDATNQRDLAAKHFQLARDWDALQFRTDHLLNETTARVATNRPAGGVRFVDVVAAFAASTLASNGVPGGRLFHEHVHFTFDGDYQLARTLLPDVAATLKLGQPAVEPASRADCARALAYTDIDDINVRTAMAAQTSKPPFLDQLDHARHQAEIEKENKERLARVTTPDMDNAVAIYRQAIAAAPEDWMLRYNFGNLLSQVGQHEAAAAEHQRVIARLPGHRAFRMTYANTLLQAGRRTEALAQFYEVLKQYPDFRPARDAINATERRLR